MSQLIGQWELVGSENFDEYLKALDVNVLIRKTVAKLKFTIVISKDGDNWRIQSLSTFKDFDYKFVDGVEFIDSLNL
jgi:hypothetical protein